MMLSVISTGASVICDKPGDQLRDDQADHDAAGDQVQQKSHALVQRRRVPGDHHRDRELQGEQAAGVVYQALAFDHVGDSLRQSQAPGDGGRGDGVGGADHRAQNQAQLPSEVRQNPARGEGYAVHGERHQAQGEQGDARDVVTKVAPGSLERGGEEQRRQEEQENHLRV
jgi:hypothetical protein